MWDNGGLSVASTGAMERQMPKKKIIITNEEIYAEVVAIKQMLAGRQHFDDKVAAHEDLMNGNGKPGFKQIRDKVLGWETKVNAIVLLIFGDIVIRIIQFAMGS